MIGAEGAGAGVHDVSKILMIACKGTEKYRHLTLSLTVTII